jgi:hypothetical protein
VNAWRASLISALAVFVLWRNLPAMLLFLFPSLMRARGEDESWPKVDRDLFGRMEEELKPLGFSRLGVHVERAPLRRRLVAYDFVNEAERTWGTATAAGEEVRLSLVTAFCGGGFVVTADHRVLSQDRQGCLVGGMPGAQPEQLLAAHRRRVEGFREQGREIVTDLSLEARVRAANAWYVGYGARELRLRNLNGLFLSLMGLAIFAAVLWAMWRG